MEIKIKLDKNWEDTLRQVIVKSDYDYNICDLQILRMCAYAILIAMEEEE